MASAAPELRDMSSTPAAAEKRGLGDLADQIESHLLGGRTALLVWLPISAITALHYGISHEHDWAHDVPCGACTICRSWPRRFATACAADWRPRC